MLAHAKTLKRQYKHRSFPTRLEDAVHSRCTLRNCRIKLRNHQQFRLWFSSRSLVAPRKRGCKPVESSCSLLVGAVERIRAELVVAWGTQPARRHMQPGCREQDILGLLETHAELQLHFESVKPLSNTCPFLDFNLEQNFQVKTKQFYSKQIEP